jgi:membrane-bound inhibitor of C-type lysozyme
MKRPISLLLAVTTVSATSIALATPSMAQEVINRAQYKCDEGKGFLAEFLADNSVRTTFGSKVLVLPEVESDSGKKYSNESVTLNTKGEEASVEVGDSILFNNCVVKGSVQGLW